MRECVRCGKKGLFLRLDAQGCCTNCSFISLEHKAVDIEKDIIDLSNQMNTVRLELANVKKIYDSITIREGVVETLASEFIQMDNQRMIKFKVENLENPDFLAENNILAVHYADGGAQGEAGAVEILYCSQQGVQILHGNYVFGNLNLGAVIRKLPMLKCLDSRNQLTPPYPFGGPLEIPDGWKYMYMGAMNHFFVRDTIRDVNTFIEFLLKHGGQSWQVFDAVAWFCGAICN